MFVKAKEKEGIPFGESEEECLSVSWFGEDRHIYNILINVRVLN